MSIDPIETLDPGKLAKQTRELVLQLAALFTECHPAVQGAALADCLAIWLAGHHVMNGTPGEVEEFREELLGRHVATVRELVQLNLNIVADLGAARTPRTKH